MLDFEISRKEAYEKLKKLTSKMKVPSYNVEKVSWLNKNLEAKNSNHPNYKEAKELVDFIMKKGWH